MGKRKKERFHVYTDGSCFMNEGRMGMGWIISRESNGKYLPGRQRLIYGGKPSSSLAEMYAVATALHEVRPNSIVVIHTDDLALCNLLNRRDYSMKIAHAKKQAQINALHSLFNAVSRHRFVEAVHETQRESPHLTRAHHLSRVACWLAPRLIQTAVIHTIPQHP